MMVQLSALPIRKLLAGGLSGLATLGMIWAGRKWFGWEIDADLAGGLVLAVGNLVGYLVPPALRDKVVSVDARMRQLGRAGCVLAIALGAGGLAACDPLVFWQVDRGGTIAVSAPAAERS